MPSGIKYFKGFFKHTWHLQQMDNPTFENVNKAEGRCTAGTELSEVKVGVSTATSTAATSTPVLSRSIPCGNGGCKATRSHGEARPESPWHLLKTIFLVSVIVALVIWVIVYTLLAQYRIL
ncbi:uncharacterized protein LOC107274093 isoform X2 [Cephus cinctus]|uniref:Uncharacterized protein LOC107274093 isoform X2 n=1 Tax=Cephus cinctus TaxID=211228 RepID=A0AAJ7CDU3_CEPCN|nr:uncharacterized protein LOC107274093 isoform X2 [Cephus cinctus]